MQAEWRTNRQEPQAQMKEEQAQMKEAQDQMTDGVSDDDNGDELLVLPTPEGPIDAQSLIALMRAEMRTKRREHQDWITNELPKRIARSDDKIAIAIQDAATYNDVGDDCTRLYHSF